MWRPAFVGSWLEAGVRFLVLLGATLMAAIETKRKLLNGDGVALKLTFGYARSAAMTMRTASDDCFLVG